MSRECAGWAPIVCDSSTAPTPRAGSREAGGTRRVRSRAMQNWVLTELDSGERVISRAARPRPLGHRRLLDRRRVARRDRRARPASRTSSSTCSSRARRGYSALEIAEIFDGLGGELNAATSREHTLVYSRVPDIHLETALDVMGDMVFSPLFDELDTEREVVLEEIAMYEDTPQELVHDLIARGGLRLAPARAAGDRHGRGDLVGLAARDPELPPRDVHARRTSSSRPPGTSTTTGSSSSSQRVGRPARRRSPTASRACGRRSCARRSPACASSARTPSSTTSASARPASRAPTAAASPPRSSTRSSAARRRRASSRRSARSAAWPTPSTASSREYADTGQIGIYVGTREDNLAERARDRGRADRRHRRRRPARERARAREGEPEGPRAALDGVDLDAHEPARQVADHRLRDPLARPDRGRGRRGRARGGRASSPALLLAPERLSAAGIGPSEERFLEALEGVSPTLARAA